MLLKSENLGENLVGKYLLNVSSYVNKAENTDRNCVFYC